MGQNKHFFSLVMLLPSGPQAMLWGPTVEVGRGTESGPGSRFQDATTL